MLPLFVAPALATPSLRVDGRRIAWPVPPAVTSYGLLAPVRAVGTAAGARVAYDQKRQAATVTTGNKRAQLRAGEDGVQLRAGRLFAPIAVLARALDKRVVCQPHLDRIDFVNRKGDRRPMLRNGEPVPDFTLPNLQGHPVSLHEFIGKKVVLFTWASW